MATDRRGAPHFVGLGAGLMAVGVVVVALEAGSGESIGVELAGTLSQLGLLSALSATVVGVFALGFIAGKGRRGVTALALGLVVIAGAWTSPAFGTRTHYPVVSGLHRESLVELAQESPNPTIVSGIGVLLRLGSILGEARLLVPDEAIAARVRAFTDLNVVTVESQPDEIERDDEPRLVLGPFGEAKLILVGDGSDDVYTWTTQNDGTILIRPGGTSPIGG